MLAFYCAYRAPVRAKVALVRAAQEPPQSDAHGSASAGARDLIAVAERFAWRARLPLVIVVCGAPASGKSCLARALAAASGLPNLSSDVARKRLAGIRPTERGHDEIYSREWSARTYPELGRRADEAVEATGAAILDATFRHLADRAAFRSSFTGRAPLLFVECDAPRSVLASRARLREHDRTRSRRAP